MILKSRRTFLKNSFLSSVIFVTCSGELFGAVTPMQAISMVQRDLFPNTQGVPKSDEINASYYLSLIFANSRVTDENKTFIRNGVKWLNEESILKYKKVYTKLPSQHRQEILKDIAKTNWGERWLDTIMTYLLEAMLGDPIYGGNRADSGWKWLNHTPGFPRPIKTVT